MAFISLELYLRDLFAAAIEEARNDDSIVDDLFGDRPQEERSAIQQYFSEHRVETDMRAELGEDERAICVVPSFILSHLPFPQIGVYMGPENSQDHFLGQETGAAPLPITKNNETVAWDTEKGYYAEINYRADIIANSKYEVIWLSRLCQRALAVKTLELEEMGVVQLRIGAADTKLEQQQYPAIVFSRAVTVSGLSLHTWKTRVPAYGYETGINTATEVLL